MATGWQTGPDNIYACSFASGAVNSIGTNERESGIERGGSKRDGRLLLQLVDLFDVSGEV